MSLSHKRTRAEQLRGELSALRLAREDAAQSGHDAAIEDSLDREIHDLEAQVARERENLSAVTGDGSAADAIAAMYASAGEPEPDQSSEAEQVPATETSPVLDLPVVGANGEEK